jgi:pSer/pThr/pTyr-binding forkhead associated (FHA) protein
MVLSGPSDVGRTIPLSQGAWVIGRDPGDAFQLQDGRVSRHHFRIRSQPDATYLLDNAQSGAPVIVSGNPLVGPTVLHDGAQIVVGNTILRFSLAGPPSGSPADNVPKRLNERFTRTLEDGHTPNP